MSAADVLAERIVTVGVPLLVVIVLLIVVAVVGLVVEQRRKWPHGRMKTCNNPVCACQASFSRVLKRRVGRLL